MITKLQQLTIHEERVITVSKRKRLYIIKVSQDMFWLEKVSTDSVALRGTGGRYVSLVELAEEFNGRSVHFD